MITKRMIEDFIRAEEVRSAVTDDKDEFVDAARELVLKLTPLTVAGVMSGHACGTTSFLIRMGYALKEFELNHQITKAMKKESKREKEV